MTNASGDWYWSLVRKRAVPAEDRERAEDVLGPYPTKEAAEHWKDRTEERNEAWAEADREWAGEDEDQVADEE